MKTNKSGSSLYLVGKFFIASAFMSLYYAVFQITSYLTTGHMQGYWENEPLARFVLIYISTFLVSVLIYLVFASIARTIKPSMNPYIQNYRDKEAEKTYIKLKYSKNTIFYLYLRPFFSDNKIMGFFSESDKYDFIGYTKNIEHIETTLANIFSSNSLIAIGRRIQGEIGAGRIETSDKTWKKVALKLILKSKYIFIIPSCNKGTLWEIKAIKDHNLFHKTIFIMPPSNNSFDMNIHWNKTKDILRKELSIILPEYSNSSVIFTLSSNGTQDGEKKITWASSSYKSIIEKLDDILKKKFSTIYIKNKVSKRPAILTLSIAILYTIISDYNGFC